MSRHLGDQVIRRRYHLIRVALRDKSILSIDGLWKALNLTYEVSYRELCSFLKKYDSQQVVKRLLNRRKAKMRAAGLPLRRRGANAATWRRKKAIRRALYDKSIITLAELARKAGYLNVSSLNTFLKRNDQNKIVKRLLKKRSLAVGKHFGKSTPRSKDEILFAKSLYENGKVSLEEVGKELFGGVSHARVGQLFKKVGGAAKGSLDPVKLMQVLRSDGSVTSYSALASRLAEPAYKVKRCIQELGAVEEADKLFASRSSKAKYLKGVQELAKRLGRTPTAKEMNAAGVHQSRVRNFWNSSKDFWKEVGLTPNRVGAKGTQLSPLPPDFKTAE